MKYIILFFIMLVLPGFLLSGERLPELKTVEQFDVNLGSGTWYEIARFTHWFQKGLVCGTADYCVLPNGKLSVRNTGRKGKANGKLDISRYKAKVTDKNTGARLDVTYFWPLHAEFYVIDLGKNYEYAVVGEPDRKYLWILSRTPKMSEEVYNGILKRLKAQCYDINKIDLTPQE